MTGTWAAGWADGDIVTAAEFRKSVGSIFDTTLGVAAAQIDVTGIVATYAHLLITVYCRSDGGATFYGLNARFNGDTGANYDGQIARGSATTASATESFGATGIRVGLCTGATASANVFSGNQIFVPNYANSSNNKQTISIDANKIGTSTTNLITEVLGGSWRSNAAINRITFYPDTGNFIAGTRLTIHAMGA